MEELFILEVEIFVSILSGFFLVFSVVLPIVFNWIVNKNSKKQIEHLDKKPALNGGFQKLCEDIIEIKMEQRQMKKDLLEYRKKENKKLIEQKIWNKEVEIEITNLKRKIKNKK